MSRKADRTVERVIVRKAIEGLFAAGYAVTTNDGEENIAMFAPDVADVDGAMASLTNPEGGPAAGEWITDTFALIAMSELHRGWVHLVAGNAEDVISDYTTNLEEALTVANEYARTF